METEEPSEISDKIGGADTDRPLLIYITSLDQRDQQVQEYMERESFREERFALGAKFFRMIRMPAEAVPTSGPMARILGGSRLPRLVFMSRDGRHFRKLEGRTSGSRAFGAMDYIVRRDLGYDLNRYVRAMGRLLNDMDNLNNSLRRLASRKASLEGERPGSRRHLEVEREEAALTEEKERIDREMTELFQEAFPPKKEESKETAQPR